MDGKRSAIPNGSRPFDQCQGFSGQSVYGPRPSVRMRQFFGNTTGWSQTVWSGSGSGCSKYEPRPTWQPTSGEGSLCPSNRTVADTSADANPSTGVAVYDSYGESGWLVFGGTSVATPLVGSIYALANNESTSSGNAAQGLYGDTLLYTVNSGQNARHCTNYLCNAADSLSGTFGFYNGPTGNGTPQGLNGF